MADNQQLTGKRQGYSINELQGVAHQLGVPAMLMKDNRSFYLVMAPNYEILKTINRDENLQKKVIQYGNEDAISDCFHFQTYCLELRRLDDNFTTDEIKRAFAKYEKAVIKIQDYAIALQAFQELDPDRIPVYVATRDTATICDLNYKRTHAPNDKIKKEYEDLLKDFMGKMIEKSKKWEIEDRMFLMTGHPLQDKKANHHLKEYEYHEVDSLEYFANHNMGTITRTVNGKLYQYFQKKMEKTKFIYYPLDKASYDLKDISKTGEEVAQKNKGTNIWANDKEYESKSFVFPSQFESMLVSWELEYLCKECRTKVLEWHTLNYVPIQELEKETTTPLREIYINRSDFHNITSLSHQHNLKLSCDFDGSYTGMKRTMDDISEIPLLYRTEDKDKLFSILRTIADARMDYIPEVHKEPVQNMDLEPVRKKKWFEKLPATEKLNAKQVFKI